MKLIAAQFVKPYVKSNKIDQLDAEAICEAMGRPGMRFITVKSIAQQAIQAANRIREELVGQRTAKANQIRGLVGEYRIIAPVGINQPCAPGARTKKRPGDVKAFVVQCCVVKLIGVTDYGASPLGPGG